MPTPTPAPPAPVIVQVENSQAARPQSGLSAAAIVYEYVAEGGISRFSAIYKTPPSAQVGPVRSARLATLSLLQLYTGLLVYSGAGEYIQGVLDSSGMAHYDETTANGDLFRVASRAAPHNLYTDGTHLTDLLRRAALPPMAYQYAGPVGAKPNGRSVASFTVTVSPSEQPTWTWDRTRNGFTRSEPDTGPFVDAVNGQPVAATTVVVQQVQITEAPQVVDVNGVHGVAHMLMGGGVAQVFTGGREYDAMWAQPPVGPPTLTGIDGTPTPFTPGSVWIELVATGSPARLAG
jgi:Protein of unknown function (DUF3048) N-terminal domain/Protein of unknown function (DUF3048) C-terminal domain